VACYSQDMARLPIWLGRLLWAAAHFVIAIAIVTCLVDYRDVVGLNPPLICENAIKMQVSMSLPAFALRCWNPAEVAPYFGVAFVATSVGLFPFTITFLALRRERRRRACNVRQSGQ
jgi:hypothetical protein